MQKKIDSKIKTIVYNLLFVFFGASLLFFLWIAPPETTPKLPHDNNHERFMSMEKKEAIKFCKECHGPKGIKPLPEDPKKHSPSYRCLLCHKRDVNPPK